MRAPRSWWPPSHTAKLIDFVGILRSLEAVFGARQIAHAVAREGVLRTSAELADVERLEQKLRQAEDICRQPAMVWVGSSDERVPPWICRGR